MAQIITPTWTLGDRLRKARKSSGLSVDAMAKALGVTRNTVTNYEADRTHPMRPTVVMWAQLTGVDPAWLDDDGAGSSSNPGATRGFAHARRGNREHPEQQFVAS